MNYVPTLRAIRRRNTAFAITAVSAFQRFAVELASIDAILVENKKYE